MSALVSFLWRNYKCHYPSEVSKQNDALRIGLLGASKIAPPAVISPAKSHPEVIVVAVAARDPKRAQAYAKKYRIPIVHDSYQTLLDDPAIDAIYIALPPGHHYEWAIKALKAEKHVLLEKPSVSNAEEAAKLFRSPLLSKTGSPVLLEAFHYRFYPAWQKLLSLIDPANIVEAHSASYLPKGIIPLYDIRCQFKLSGGCLMDLGMAHVYMDFMMSVLISKQALTTSQYYDKSLAPSLMNVSKPATGACLQDMTKRSTKPSQPDGGSQTEASDPW